MNSKIMTYDAAVSNLKQLEKNQRDMKKRIYLVDSKSKAYIQQTIEKQKILINNILSIIYAYKQARKYYGMLYFYEKK